MLKTLKTLTLSAMIALGAAGGLTATTSSASATGIVITGGGHHGHFGLYFGDDYGRGWGHGWRRGHCPSGRAVHKARRMGLHRAHIRFRNHRVVAVAGRKHGHHRTFLFANVRHCPRIR